MEKTIELITIDEIKEKTGLKRDAIYKSYRKFFISIPTTEKKSFFDKESVIEAFVKVRNVPREEIEKIFS